MIQRTTRWRSFAVVAAALAAAPSGSLLAQTSPALGPKDGTDLAPTDTGRVTVGTKAPDFTLEARGGRRITLSDYRGKQNVVMVFYRGHW